MTTRHSLMRLGVYAIAGLAAIGGFIANALAQRAVVAHFSEGGICAPYGDQAVSDTHVNPSALQFVSCGGFLD